MATSKVRASGLHLVENGFAYINGWEDQDSSREQLKTKIYASNDAYYINIRAKLSSSASGDTTNIFTVNLPDILFNANGAVIDSTNKVYSCVISASVNRAIVFGGSFTNGATISGSIVLPRNSAM